ncbi:type 2 isopentenyl-diphosphate Delta-isomerase [Erysipelothrix urinaevulpis]|uniref:type 2 isopentenyl-diphosphate Delta-isomerase n=1 Tax=Erysipelothrix urinaevulpis TaxID=2683717 RepID=UPI00135AB499|nr:type 2 isopentenyl-diphosphate Delta-isomerase [Erysipelothrix urinaevulpis]
MTTRSKRKDEHVKLALAQHEKNNDFDLMRFYHHSFPEINYRDIDLSTHYLGQTFNYPFYINAMTGGSEKTKELNRKFALIAKRYGLMMVLGSQHAALDDKTLEESYRVVRDVNPEGFILGNINPNASVTEAKRAVEMIHANALSIHINPAQELTMDEGDRDFSHWLHRIESINKELDVPVIVKEVGFGMSRYTINQLQKIGIKHIDVSGKGGTNFVTIENTRSEGKRFSYLENWGLSTVESLIEAKPFMNKVEIMASGGIRNPLDVIKALALGAQAVGLSSVFLKMVHDKKEEEMYAEVDQFIDELKRIMLLLGKTNPRELTDTDIIWEGRLKER